MILSQQIARMLEEMLEEAGGELSIVRNELALRFGCVPSQINYVISSRFTPERGYVVESRRGGGGFVRIRKVAMSKNEFLERIFHSVESGLDLESARGILARLIGLGMMTQREGELVLSALSDTALSALAHRDRNTLRAGIFRSVILTLMNQKEEE